MSWPPDPDEVRRHDKRAYKQRQGQAYNGKPPGGGWCPLLLAVLMAVPALLVRLGVRKARRR